MQPSYLPAGAPRRQHQRLRQSTLQPRGAATTPSNVTPPAARDSDSWIEVAAHLESSSSDEHIITSGLRIASRRRRRSAPCVPGPHSNLAATSLIGTESEEDEAEQEAEEPQDVASFIAALPLSSSGFTTSSASTDDEGGEAEGEESSEESDQGRTVFASTRSVLPPRLILKDEHDAALRASLSTLLSCAAAARGLSRNGGGAPESSTMQSGLITAARPTRGVEGLRVIQGDRPPTPATAMSSPRPASKQGNQKRRRPSKTSSSSSVAVLPSKKATTSSDRNSYQAHIKKIRDLASLNNGLTTLALSAGAIVVLGAISFSAGYWVGREMGKNELEILGSIHAGGGSSRVVRQVGRVTG